MAAVFPEFSVNISQRRWSCVLDPTLALSSFGIPLVTRLGRVLDLWVARELWHILDNAHIFLQQPETLLAAGEGAAERSQIIRNVLREWDRIRMENDPSRQHLYWIGDGPLESFLPEGQEPDIVWRQEALCAALDRLLPDRGVLAAAQRDTLSLAACLPAAFVLTHLPPGTGDQAVPDICGLIARVGIPCRQVPGADPWCKDEKALISQIFTNAGLGKWMWTGLRPAVLQVTAPAALTTGVCPVDELAFMESGLPESGPDEEPPKDYWRDTQCFWYAL